MLRCLFGCIFSTLAFAQIGDFRSLPETRMDEFRALAEQGDAEAQNNMGLCFNFGHKNWDDDQKALFWFQKAAAQGHVEAMYNLGYVLTYNSACGIERQEVEGAKWVQKAATAGYQPALSAMGFIYRIGIGVTADQSKSTYWYNKANEQLKAATLNNDPEKQVKIGMELQRQQKYSEAVKWYKKAANQGYTAGINALAYCYYWGRGIEEDIDKAIELYETSADKGDEKATRELSTIRNSLKYQVHLSLKNQKDHPSTGATVNKSSNNFDWAGHRAAVISQCGLSQTAMRDPAMQNLVNAYLDYSARCERAGIAPTDPNRINAESSLIQNILEYKYNRGY